MNQYKNPFLYLMYALIIVGGVLVIFFNKGDMVLYLNIHHNKIADIFFKYITFLGDGLMLIPFFLILVFRSKKESIQLLSISLFVLLLSQGLKKSLFSGMLRPTAFLGKDIEWNFVEGVTVVTNNTFPSGHTLTAFAIFFFASLLINKKWAFITGFLLALSVAISRVYLLQHFFIDVYFGAILGVLAVYIGLKVTKQFRFLK
ncbi:MAG: phosphatase PAP2 family protein [Cyclobacteriaceae bacterium]|nr:phosphatase PAP2 family protein [Cyclobacteriaceae bacterium]